MLSNKPNKTTFLTKFQKDGLLLSLFNPENSKDEFNAIIANYYSKFNSKSFRFTALAEASSIINEIDKSIKEIAETYGLYLTMHFLNVIKIFVKQYCEQESFKPKYFAKENHSPAIENMIIDRYNKLVGKYNSAISEHDEMFLQVIFDNLNNPNLCLEQEQLKNKLSIIKSFHCNNKLIENYSAVFDKAFNEANANIASNESNNNSTNNKPKI